MAILHHTVETDKVFFKDWASNNSRSEAGRDFLGMLDADSAEMVEPAREPDGQAESEESCEDASAMTGGDSMSDSTYTAPGDCMADAMGYVRMEAGGRGYASEKHIYRFLKRAFDIVFSACVIVVGLIPGLVLALFVAADTKGNPIYRSTRIGRGGKPFRILKYRSMVADSDDLEKYFTPEQLDQWHREHKVEDDPRITKMGRFLRASSIDELPQFINVFIGQMSVIGSRAVTAEEVEYYGEAKEAILSMRPGITGLWQTGPRNIATYESGLRQQLELEYVQKASLLLDTKLFFKTFQTIFEGTGR